MTRRAEAAGADAVLSVVPYYNKPMQAGIHAHFRAIAVSTSLPIILHDIPSRTIRELSDDTLARLAKSAQFIGLRDGTGDLARPLRLRSLLPPGFRLLSGDDATALAFIANGGDGCISLVSNVAPDLCQAIFSSCRQGRLQSAAIPAKPAGAADGGAGKRKPRRREICALPAGLDVAGHPPADRRTGRCSAGWRWRAAIAEIGDEEIACPAREPAWPPPSGGHGRHAIEASRMSSSVHGSEWHARTLRAWQLAMLRFAVTLDNADRLAVMAIAAEIDRLAPSRTASRASAFSAGPAPNLRRYSAAE